MLPPLRFFRQLSLAFAFVASAAFSAAAAPAEDPAPELTRTINAVLDLTIGESPETITSRVPQIRDTMDEIFATSAIVRRAFGRNWSRLNPEQQNEVTDLLGRVIIRTYAGQLSTAERPIISIVSSKQIAPERREIVSTATQKDKVVNIIYRLAPIDGKWKVYDVLAENVSVVGNYRQQFDEHFKKNSAEDLLKTLREKVSAPLPVEQPKK